MSAFRKSSDTKDLDDTDRLPALAGQVSDAADDTGTHIFRLSDTDQASDEMPAAHARTATQVEPISADTPDPFEQTTVFHPDQVATLRSLDSGAAAQLRANLEETTSALEDALESLADREMAIAALRVELRDERSAKDRAEQTLQGYRDDREQLRGELEAQRARAQALASDLATLARERTQAIAEAERLSGEADEHRHEIQALRSQLADARKAMEVLGQNEAAASDIDDQALAENIQDLRAYINARGATWRAMQQRLAEQQERLDELTRELAQRERQHVDYRSRLQAADSEIQRLREGPRAMTSQGSGIVDTAASTPRRSLVVIMGRNRMRYPLGTGVTTIGRTTSNDIQISTQYISRQHAVLNCSATDCTVEDLGSRNGILVNGELVRRHQLRDGDEIVLGRTSMRYEETAHDDPMARTL